MENALSTLNILPSNKDQVKTFVSTIKSEILANDKNALPILVQLKMAEKTISDILKDEEIDLHFLKEYEGYAKNEKVVINGATLTQSEVGVSYLYEDSGDPEYNRIVSEIDKLTILRKEREKFLQNIPYDQGVVDPTTGVFITRPPKKSKTKVKVLL